ncbi:MAG: VIT1/CCC1 transporter family protein, partial [Dokdonella sp.]|uniref:VIT1/CCC1 transporter family protein n=1 Tax=Dokdonella sp. TaxID=2291710 RepID=UPI003BAEECC8
ALPLLSAVVAPASGRVATIMLSSLVFLAALGAVAARTGGAPMLRGAWRVVFWSALAMAVTAVVGYWFGGSTV